MDGIVAGIEKINGAINGVVWGIPMLVLIIATGIYLTVRTGFFQVIRAKFTANETFLAIFKKRSVTKTKDKKAISQFQALTTALAATIGTGNIVGVATAIAIGGPGAVFWMWISAFFGMMTNFSENVLGIFYRKKNAKGEWSGGAMYYIEEGLKTRRGLKHIAKPLAILFAVFCMFASFGIGNMSQINSISATMSTNFGIPALVTGLVLAALAALVILGGIKRIGSVAEKLVPFMAGAYIIGALIIFFSNIHQVGYVFGSIFKNAFAFTSIAGGAGGYAVKRAVTWGFKRGVFSNEAGLGSSVMVHSASDVKEPVVQGMWGIFEVFFDTIIVCTLTAFILLSSTTGAVPAEEAFANVTTGTQYFEIADAAHYTGRIPLIDAKYNEAYTQADANDDPAALTDPVTVTAYGRSYTVPRRDPAQVGESGYIYTNVMAVTGVQAVDENGQKLTDENGNPILKEVNITPLEGASLVTYAMQQRFGPWAGKLLSIAILLFAFTTVLGWSFYGTKATEYLFGTKSTIVYRIIFIVFIVFGATMDLSLAWDISDTLNGLMALPNLIGVLILSGTVIKITKNYTARKIRKNAGDIEPMLSAYPEIQKMQADALRAEQAEG